MVDSRWSRALPLLIACLSLLLQATSAQDVTVGFTESSVTVPEAAGSVTLQVTLNRTLEDGETINLTVSATDLDGTAMNGSDFGNLAPTTLSFSNSSAETLNVSVRIINDGVLEDTETFFVNLTLGDFNISDYGMVEFENQTVEVSIVYDDVANVTLAVTPLSVSEDSEVVTACVSIYPVAQIDVVVVLSTADGTATQPEDYWALYENVTIVAGMMEACVNISIVNDDIVEYDETFNVTMTTTNGRLVLINNMAEVTILSDPTDVANVTLVVTPLSVSEDSGVVTACVSIYPVAQMNVVVMLSTADGTATAPGDYTALYANLTIWAGMMQSCVNISIVNDDIVEYDETFSVTMTTMNDRLVLINNVAEVTILSDPTDVANVTLVVTPLSVSEDSGVVTACVSIYPVAQMNVVVVLSTADGTATAPEDYTALYANVTIWAGMMQSCVNISIVNDDIVEYDETFSVTMTTTNDRLVLINNMTEVTILSDPTDVANVTLVVTPLSVSEDSGVVTACVTISPVVQMDVVVMLCTADGTAKAPGDYMALYENLTIVAGTMQSCVDIIIVNDDIVEDDETFSVTMTTTNGRLVPIDDMAEVTILSDPTDMVNVSINGISTVFEYRRNFTVEVSITSNFERSVSVNLTVVRDNAMDRRMPVEFSFEDGSSFSNPASTVLTFDPANRMNQTVTVFFTTDECLESTEGVTVAVKSSDTSVMVVTSPYSVYIIDSDSVTIGFGSSAYMMVTQVLEGYDTMVPVNITMGCVNVNVTVDVTYKNLTAGMTELEVSPANLTFDGSNDLQYVRVSSPEDTVLEYNGLFALTLTNPVPSSRVTVYPDSVNVTVIDNAANVTIGLLVDSYTVEEGSSFKVSVVVVIGTLERSAMLNITTVSGTASENVEFFAPSPDTVTLDANTSTVRVEIATADLNGVVEVDKMFTVRLEAVDPSGITVSPSTSQVTIEEGDSATIGLTQTEITVIEGRTAEVCVSVTNGTLGREVIVQLTTDNGTATAPADYTSVGTMLTFNSTVSSLCEDIATSSDNEVSEGSETFTVSLTSSLSPSVLNLQPATATVTIVDAPFITQQPVDQYVLVGDNASFSVTASGVGISYQWLRNEVALMDVAGKISGSTNTTLTIYNVSSEDLGNYTCDISNAAADTFTMAVVLRILPEVTISTPPTDRGVLEGNTTELNCSVVSLDGAATIVWSAVNPMGVTIALPNSSDVTSASGTTITSTILIEAIDASYTGVYTCNATNRVSSASANFNLSVITVFGVNDVVVSPGNAAMFFCNATGDPTLDYQWAVTRMGSVPTASLESRFPGGTLERVTGANTSSLTITNVTLSDNDNNTDTVVCTISLFGVMIARVYGGFEILRVVLTEGPMSQTVTAGDTAVLTCTAENTEGAPNSLTFRWRVNASDVVVLNERVTVTTDVEGNGSNVTTGVLTITNTVYTDNGRYYCRVTNNGRADAVESGIANLTILFVPVVVDIQVEVGGILQVAANNRFRVNARDAENDAVFTMIAVPFVTEVRVFRLDSSGSRIENVTNCLGFSTPNVVRCTLPALNVSESGTQFEVEAINAIGNGARRFELTVQDVPEPVNVGMLQSTVEDLLRVRLTWPIPGDNNAKITAYTIMYCHILNPTTCVASEPRTLPANDTDVLTTNQNQRTVSYVLQHGASLDASIRVNITATNSVGEGGTLNGPSDVAVATTADATPTNVRTSALTDTFAVVAWDLLPAAIGDGIVLSNYTANYMLTGTGASYSAGVPSQAFLLDDSINDGVIPGRPVVITVTANYASPPVSGATSAPFTFTILRNASEVTPLLTGVPTSNPLSAVQAIIGWTAPDDTDLLTGYRVNYESVPLNPVTSRRKREAPPSGSVSVVGAATTSTLIPTCAFSDVTTSVDIVYPGGRRAPLLQPTTFQTTETEPTAPRTLMVITDGTQSLKCDWLTPDPTNGIIINYIVSYRTSAQPVNQARREGVGNDDTTYTISGLQPNTDYIVVIIAQTRVGDGPQSNNGMAKTGFGVTRPPTIAVQTTAVSSQFSVRFTVSRSDGPISDYQVIVSRNKLPDSTSVMDIGPYSAATTVLYVARFGTLGETQTTGSVDIGTGETVTSGTTQFTDQELNGNTDYYIFIRVFSSLLDNNERKLFNDSEISGPIRFSPGLNTVAVIAPIAAIAGILIIVLIVLLVVAYCTMASPFKRFGGYVVSNNVERRQGGKGGAAMELRRTRLFAPVLNVGTSDVFTSANQPTTLICEASGTPAPAVSWTRDKEPLDNKERFIELADGSLFINDTDLQDEGTYVVRAVNSAGEAEELVRMTVLRPIPPEADTEHPPIKVGEFSEKIALVRADDDEGLEDEYADVELDWTFTSYSAKLNINKNKNRYINIIPYDHSRVVLSLQDNTPGSDYINASFIDAYQRPNGYIASQGPIPSTFPDFWRMIWELDSPTIVMVTNLKEEDKIKCHQYWPSYGTTTYGNIQVTLKEVENLAEYSIRTFNVSPLAGQSRVQMPVREVRQFHFLVWPDHGVPTYATNLLSFRKRILKYHPEKRGPMAVHCSAGVGRTGTFITIDYMLKQIEAEGIIDIFNFVRHMRYRRNYMVQTSPQYVFIHDALLESIMCGDNSIKAPELKEKVKELREVVPETGVSMFETQFNTLKTASPPDDDFDCSIAKLPDNASKNRSRANLPANDYRVVLSSEKDQPDYICASYVDNYRERNAFIVTQAPLEETVKDFWRMIWETKSAAIVMLTELMEEGQEMSVKYWPSTKEEPSVYGGYQVVLSEEEKDRGDYITRRFKLSPVDNPQESRMVSQFHFVRWSKTLPPKDCRPMIDLIDELQRVQRKSGNMPITVHCDDGIGRTGAFCTLYSVLERVKTEQIVDVFQAVKTLRIQRTGLLSTISEYEFVHYAVIEFLETFSEYQNFK